MAFSHTDVSYGTVISGGNSLTSRTLINMLTFLVNNVLPVKNIKREKMTVKFGQLLFLLKNGITIFKSPFILNLNDHSLWETLKCYVEYK